MGDRDIRERAANTSQTEGDRWSSDPGTVERRDRDRPESGADTDPSASGISKRSDDEERANQDAVPPREEEKGGKKP
jgi:hypothetical protein